LKRPRVKKNKGARARGAASLTRAANENKVSLATGIAREETAPAAREEARMATGHGEEGAAVSRYTAGARVNHWITAASLVLLALSGLSLFHPSLFFLSELFGGGQNVAIIHPWIGVVLSVSFLGLFLRFFTLNLPERTDATWLGRLGSVLSGHDENLPEIGKYNAGQKLVFWLQTILIILMLISGLALWEARFGTTFTIEQKRLAAVVHAISAVLSILVWIVHVYAAIWVKGTVRGMMRGNVSGGWAWRHHRRWLREEVAKEHTSRPAE
jgi:formate dehydrogenase subunit gamma